MNQSDPSPVADCKCGHPYASHAPTGAHFCGVASCACHEFRELDSKLSRTTRCYVCDSLEHPTKVCPYAKGRKEHRT